MPHHFDYYLYVPYKYTQIYGPHHFIYYLYVP